MVPDIGGMITGMVPDIGGMITGMVPDIGGMITGMVIDIGGMITGMVPDIGGYEYCQVPELARYDNGVVLTGGMLTGWFLNWRILRDDAGMVPDIGGMITGMVPDIGGMITGMVPDIGGTIAGMVPYTITPPAVEPHARAALNWVMPSVAWAASMHALQEHQVTAVQNNRPGAFFSPGNEDSRQAVDLDLGEGRDKGVGAARRPMLRPGGFEGTGSGVTWADVPDLDDEDSGPKVVQIRPNIKKPGPAPGMVDASGKSGCNWLAAGAPSQPPGARLEALKAAPGCPPLTWSEPTTYAAPLAGATLMVPGPAQGAVFCLAPPVSKRPGGMFRTLR
eukprot:gene17671-24021_t